MEWQVRFVWVVLVVVAVEIPWYRAATSAASGVHDPGRLARKGHATEDGKSGARRLSLEPIYSKQLTVTYKGLNGRHGRGGHSPVSYE